MNENVTLCFVREVGSDIDGNNIYELLFTEDSDSFWGDGFEYMPASLVNDLTPNQDSYCVTKSIKTTIKLCLAVNSCCHSMQDCIDKIVALAYEDISTYDEFPDEGRLVLHFGESYDETERKLAERNIFLMDSIDKGED